MKKVVPFTRTMTFRTMIAEITDIEVSHNLHLEMDHEICGDILVDGKYKMTDASQIEEEFHYELPFTIEVDDKYKLDNLDIAIGDFYFEIINEEDLKINVEIDLDGLEEIEKGADVSDYKLEELEEVRSDIDDAIPIPIELNEDPMESLEKEIKEDLNMDVDNSPLYEQENLENHVNNVSSIFTSLSSSEETFSTYYVYIMRESDTLEGIMDKYKINKEMLSDYNDLSDIKVGSKLIIPCATNE